ncbi:Fpg/Nei family DNA glycosylase [Pseudonocardia adelaidensis]|uniref:Formamidopyrimidine-DNA glycosylase n=1 Tax=Pseudonocardia adelaidensis TaxID=648754 RepID=A0ABP9NSK1_9PSEU
MPELPDVEGFRRVLAEHGAGRPVQGVDVLDRGVLRGIAPKPFAERLRGRRLEEPSRHGKWLIVPVRDGPVLLAHFGMTGSLEWAPDGVERHRHDRVVFVLPGGELRYRDMRKLQGLRLAADDGEVEKVLGDVGPDALTVTRAQLRELLRGRRRQVKPALADQSVLAGLGNLLADEILWHARIHPRRTCAVLTDDDLARLHRSMRSVLRRSVAAERVPPRPSWLTGHRDDRPGSCPRCGAALAHGRTGGRGTTWCPHCQPD